MKNLISLKRRSLNYFLIVALTLAGLLKSEAQNFQYYGGDITWECMGNDSFLIYLTLYKDADSVTQSTKPQLNIGCWNNPSSSFISTTGYISETCKDITPACSTQCTASGSGCNNGKDASCSFYGIEKVVYTYGVNLGTTPGGCCDLRLSYSQGFRNTSGTNLANIAGQKVYLEARMNKCLVPCNNSPDFFEDPLPLSCVGKVLSLNLGGYSNDTGSTGIFSDSVVYSFVTPKTTYNTNVTYTGSYAGNMPVRFDGFPNLPAAALPKGIHLDSKTGLLQFTPTTQEEAIVAIKASEYRKGSLVSEITREFTLFTENCTSNNLPVISGLNGKAYSDLNVCAGNEYCFTIDVTDPDGDSISLEWEQGNLDNVTFNQIKGKSPSLSFCWTTQARHIGNTYKFSVRASDGNCPVEGIVSRVFRLTVNPDFTLDITDSIYQCNQLLMEANGGHNSINWEENGNLLSGLDSFWHYIQDTGNHTIRVYASNNVCTRIHDLKVNIPSLPAFSISTDTTICGSDSAQLSASGGTQFSWSPATGLSDPSISNPYAKPDTTTLYHLEIRDGNGCIGLRQVEIRVIPRPKITYSANKLGCNSVKFKSGNYPDSTWIIKWTYQGGESNNKRFTGYITQAGSSNINLSIFNPFCSFDYNTTINIDTVPFVDAGNDTFICTGDTITLKAEGLDSFEWKPANGLSNPNLANPVASPPSTATYIVRSWSSSGLCSLEDTMVIFVDTQCVWPGDANYDRVSNYLDVLNIGFAYNEKGPGRNKEGIAWDGYPSTLWDSSFPSGLNYKHADCNGDGVIDTADVRAISANYSMTRNKTDRKGKKGPNDPPLTFSFINPVDTLEELDTFEGVVTLGTAAKQASNILGMTYKISFNKKLVDSASITVSFANSWIGTSTNTLSYAYNNFPVGKIEITQVKTDRKTVSGYGTVALIKGVVIDNVISKKDINRLLKIEIVDAQLITGKLGQKDVNPSGDSLMVRLTSLPGRLADTEITLYPNPSNGKMKISSNNMEIHEVAIYNMVGQMEFSEKYIGREKDIKIDLSGLPSGMYIARIKTENQKIYLKRFSIAE